RRRRAVDLRVRRVERADVREGARGDPGAVVLLRLHVQIRERTPTSRRERVSFYAGKRNVDRAAELPRELEELAEDRLELRVVLVELGGGAEVRERPVHVAEPIAGDEARLGVERLLQLRVRAA